MESILRNQWLIDWFEEKIEILFSFRKRRPLTDGTDWMKCVWTTRFGGKSEIEFDWELVSRINRINYIFRLKKFGALLALVLIESLLQDWLDAVKQLEQRVDQTGHSDLGLLRGVAERGNSCGGWLGLVWGFQQVGSVIWEHAAIDAWLEVLTLHAMMIWHLGLQGCLQFTDELWRLLLDS